MNYAVIDEARPSSIPEKPEGALIGSSKALSVTSSEVSQRFSSDDRRHIRRIVIRESSNLTELEAFSEFPAVQEIEIESKRIKSEGLQCFSNLTALTLPKGFKLIPEHISELPLIRLGLAQPTDKTLMELRNSLSIEELALGGVKLDRNWDAIPLPSRKLILLQAKGKFCDLSTIPGLQHLELLYCSQLSELTFPGKLIHLEIENCRKISNSLLKLPVLSATLRSLGNFADWAILVNSDLQDLTITDTAVPAITNQILKSAPNLRSLFVGGLSNSTDELKEFSEIFSLKISNGEFTFCNGEEWDFWDSLD